MFKGKRLYIFLVGSWVLIMGLIFAFNFESIVEKNVSADVEEVEYENEEERLYTQGEYEQLIVKLTNKGELTSLTEKELEMYTDSIFTLFEEDTTHYVDVVHKKVNRDLLTDSDSAAITDSVSKFIHHRRSEINKGNQPPTKPLQTPKPQEVKLLVLEETSCETGVNYTHAKGYVKNNSNSTIYFIEISSVFTDDLGNIIDSNYTYGAGSEGLQPNSRKSFEVGVPTNSSITKCKSGITDFQF